MVDINKLQISATLITNLPIACPRLSIGIEHIDDLIVDLKNALNCNIIHQHL